VARAVAAVGQVSVDGEDDSLVTEVRLFAHDEENSSLKETNVIPAYVNVSVAIAEVREEKEVPVNPVLEDKPAEGFRVDSVTLEPETVTVVGARSVVNKLDSISTEGVSIEEAAEDVVVEVPLQLPQGLDWTEPALVKVRVGIVSE
jgi:YbbR domain-containing protein